MYKEEREEMTHTYITTTLSAFALHLRTLRLKNSTACEEAISRSPFGKSCHGSACRKGLGNVLVPAISLVVSSCVLRPSLTPVVLLQCPGSLLQPAGRIRTVRSCRQPGVTRIPRILAGQHIQVLSKA